MGSPPALSHRLAPKKLFVPSPPWPTAGLGARGQPRGERVGGQGLRPMATGTLDSVMHLALRPQGICCPIQPPTAHGSVWEGQARTAALFSAPENVTCLSPGHGHHHEMAFLGEVFPIFHPWGLLDTEKLSRLGFDMLHSLALLVKRTFFFFFN